MKLSLAKLVELRRRSRIDRARQLASNIETQAHILRQTELYNLQAEYLRMKQLVRPFGENIPAVLNATYRAIQDNINDIESKPTVAAIAPTVVRQRTIDGDIVTIPLPRRPVTRQRAPLGRTGGYVGPGLEQFMRSR